MSELRGRRRTAVAAVWGVGDQAVSSLGNLAVSVLTARVASPGEFGAFVVAFTVYSVAVTASRAALSMTHIMDSKGGTILRPDRDSGVVTAALVIGGALGVVLLAIGLAVDGGPGRFLVALAVGMPLLLAQDSLRFVMQLRRGVRAMFLVDLSWLLAEAVLMGGWLLLGAPRAETVLVLWGASAGVSVVLACRQLRLRLSLGATRALLTSSWRVAGPNLGEALVSTGSAQLASFALAGLATLEALGALRGAQVLFGPMNVALGGLLVLLTPAVVAAGATSNRRLLRTVAVAAGGLTAVAAVITVALALLPDSLGRQVLGDSWSGAEQVIVPTGVLSVATALATCATLGFKGLGVVTTTFWLRCALLPVAAVAAVVGYRIGDLRGASIGLAGAALLTAGLLWLLLLVRVRQEARTAQPATASPAPAQGRPEGSPPA